MYLIFKTIEKVRKGIVDSICDHLLAWRQSYTGCVPSPPSRRIVSPLEPKQYQDLLICMVLLKKEESSGNVGPPAVINTIISTFVVAETTIVLLFWRKSVRPGIHLELKMSLRNEIVLERRHRREGSTTSCRWLY